MRISIKLKVNHSSLLKRKLQTTPSIDFNDKNKIVNRQLYAGWLNKKAGKYHDEFSTYNNSGIIGGYRNKLTGQLIFESGYAEIKLSSLNEQFLEDVLLGIKNNPIVNTDAFYFDVIDIKHEPFQNLDKEKKFFTISPIFLPSKNRIDGERRKQYTFEDEDSLTSSMMTETLKNRIEKLNLGINTKDLIIKFDQSYVKKKVVKVFYKTKENKTSVIIASKCPVVISGDPKAIEAAFYLGVGFSTGAGFGCISDWKKHK